MNLTVKKSKLGGSIAVPGSKSHTIRAAAFALMADGISKIRFPLISQDTLSAAGAVRAFGGILDRGDDTCWSIQGTGGNLRDPGNTVDMANSGTSIKIFAGLAALCSFPVTFDGDESLRSRPMGHLLSALSLLNVKTVSKNGKCPFTVHGPIRGNRTEVNSESSQYVTALLMSLPFGSENVSMDVVNLNEKPYIEITLGWMDTLGLKYTRTDDFSHFEIPGKQRIAPFDITIPADFSTAAFPLVAAGVTGSELKILNLDFSDRQGDKAVFGYLEKMGMEVIRSDKVTTVRPHGKLKGVDLDLNATPDALPAIAVAAAFADGITRIRNVAQARIKETDRISCMTAELRKMGIQVEEHPDGMTIRGGMPKGTAVESYKDHRIAMALAAAGLAAEGTTVIRDAECAGVTYPGFFNDFKRLGASFSQD